MDFTKEKIRKLADLLMIGLTDEETDMVFDEFEIIDKNNIFESYFYNLLISINKFNII